MEKPGYDLAAPRSSFYSAAQSSVALEPVENRLEKYPEHWTALTWKLNDSISVCFGTGISMDRCLCLVRKRELVNGQFGNKIRSTVFDDGDATMDAHFSNEKRKNGWKF